MAISNLSFIKNGDWWETVSHRCSGGDLRIRVHKNGAYPVNIMVSIDGVEEFLRHDDFGFDERMCEVTLAGVMPGQFVKLVSRSEFTLVKILEI